MISLANGAVGWDVDLRTYRGEVDGVIHGVHGGQYLRPEGWAAAAGVTLTSEQIAELVAMRDTWLGDGKDREPVVIAPIDFLRLMTDTEVASILAAADQNYAIKAWLYRFERAQSVSRVHPETVGGVNALYGAGLLSAETRNRIVEGG